MASSWLAGARHSVLHSWLHQRAGGAGLAGQGLHCTQNQVDRPVTSQAAELGSALSCFVALLLCRVDMSVCVQDCIFVPPDFSLPCHLSLASKLVGLFMRSVFFFSLTLLCLVSLPQRERERTELSWIEFFYFEDDGFNQSSLVYIIYTQTCTYDSDTVITLENKLTVLICHQSCFFYYKNKKIKKKTIQANVIDLTSKLSMEYITKWQRTD